MFRLACRNFGTYESLVVNHAVKVGTTKRSTYTGTMSNDPVDDCTFWYTNEYLKADGTFNWSTRIHSFKLASCI